MNEDLTISETVISALNVKGEEYLSLTDVAKGFGSKEIVNKWLNDGNTKEFLAVWEKFNNPGFNSTEFEKLKSETGVNQDLISTEEWIRKASLTGITLKAGKEGEEIFAHKDIAFEFGLWLSPEFKIFLLKEYHRLKAEENMEKSLKCNLKEILSKIHIKIKSRPDKESFIPKPVTVEQMDFLYENEADILNVAMFGMTAKQWHESNPDKIGCPKDHSTMEQMIVLTNLESIDSGLIDRGLSQTERLEFLNKQAIAQMRWTIRNI